jgi:polyferredoxin
LIVVNSFVRLEFVDKMRCVISLFVAIVWFFAGAPPFCGDLCPPPTVKIAVLSLITVIRVAGRNLKAGGNKNFKDWFEWYLKMG